MNTVGFHGLLERGDQNGQSEIGGSFRMLAVVKKDEMFGEGCTLSMLRMMLMTSRLLGSV